MAVTLIADSGATKCEWCLLHGKTKRIIVTAGISPYFLSGQEIIHLLQLELLPHIDNIGIDNVAYYGTGLGNIGNVKTMKAALRKVFPKAIVEATHDLLAAARALCGKNKGIACILGTGSNSCYYNGTHIKKNSPGIGYVLGDEGSGAYLGKKVLQYFLYNMFDEDLRARFDATFAITPKEILEHVYTKPFPSRYLASYTMFLAQNRGHYMVENIIEDGLNDFFFQHLCKYTESWKLPVHFAGSVAFGFRDVLKELCRAYEFELGSVIQKPMEGLIRFHTQPFSDRKNRTA